MMNTPAGLYLPLTPDLMHLVGGEQGLKAMTAEVGSRAINVMGAVPENLEMQAHVALWDRDDLRLLRELPSVDAASVKHEFGVVDSYGNVQGTTLFAPEGGLGMQTGYNLARLMTRIVTLQLVNKVTGTARAEKTMNILGSTDALVSNREAVMRNFLMLKAISTIFSRASASTSTLRFSGLLEQFQARNQSADFAHRLYSCDPNLVIDKRGAWMSRSDVKSAGTQMYKNGWGKLNRIFMTPETSENFQGEVETNFPIERVDVKDIGDQGLILGATVAGIRHQGGIAMFMTDNSLDPALTHGEFKGDPPPNSPVRPDAPTIVTANAVANSKWEDIDIPADAGVIKYKVLFENDFGPSQPSVASAGTNPVTGCRNRLTINTRADAKSVKILRNSAQRPTEFYVIGEIANTGAVLTFDDLNWKIPGSAVAIGLEMMYGKSQTNRLNARARDNAVRFAQLEELHSVPLAKIGDFDWEMLIERTSPELVQKLRMVVWENIGR